MKIEPVIKLTDTMDYKWMQLKRNVCDFLLEPLFNILDLNGLGCRSIVQKHLYHWSHSQTIKHVFMHFKSVSTNLNFEIYDK